mmetsp:Transcript_27971/g.34507  ORF Transcript_27971/g.34507 Transcript_27971/m.34507 type:complete len:800 (-) Transcript_27971:148-2547(-)
MWSNLLSSGEAAKERLASALERTNEALSQRASTHAQNVARTSSMSPSSMASRSKEEEDTNQSPKEQGEGSASSFFKNINQQQPKGGAELYESLKTGWGSVLEATKNAVETTKDAVEKEQTRIHASLFANGPYKRDLSLPLDTEALRDAEVVYLTDRLITMSHPAMQSPTNGDITPQRKLAAVAHLLQKRHGGKFMIWNVSELEYDYSILEDQVMTFQFPGSPSPPLGLLLKILLSVESWLKADSENVAVMHCLTGRGRTSTIMAAFLCWMGEAGFGGVDPTKALEYIAYCKRIEPDILTIPSQRRYVTYFKNMMDGVRPSQPPLLLMRIIMSEAPKFGKNMPPDDKNDDETSRSKEKEQELGCAPYVQIFKAGKLVFTTAASKSYNQSKDDLPFCVASEGQITFPVETIVQGDILIRCRHLTRRSQRVSMFRVAFHTGYVPPKVLRLTKAQLDGACTDKRYTDDFFLDFIFEECSTSMASKHLISVSGEDAGNKTEEGNPVLNEAAARRMGGTITSSNNGGISGSAYDSMLHRDSRFWDVIAERREENRNKLITGTSEQDGEGKEMVRALPFYGPTIGRRREFADEVKSDKSSTEGSMTNVEVASHHSIQSFSIGGELDFTVDDEHPEKTGTKQESYDCSVEEPSAPKEVKKDDLMEALMAIDDDVDAVEEVKNDPDLSQGESESDTLTEEIVFDGNQDKVKEEEEAVSSVLNETPIQKEKETVENAKSEASEDQILKSDMESEKSKQSSLDTSLVKIDGLDLDDDDLDLDDSGDFDLDDDDDDEELQDLEQFLMKAKS